MNFASDNAGPVHPKVMEALIRANEGYAMPYGNDALSRQVEDRIRDIFEAPDAAVYLVATGTAANSLLLATLAKPWSTIFCAPHSHINEDECNAPEFYSGGAKLSLVAGENAKIGPAELAAAIAKEETRGVHGPQRGPVSITQATEKGTVYELSEIREITSIARRNDLKVHMDGARFANAVVRLGCSPADMTWRAGVDTVSFGGTKNGLMGVEAAVIFDRTLAWEFELRRKRGAHLFSKHRYLAAQMHAYLDGDLWLDMASAANAACQQLARGLRQVPGAAFHYEPDANIIFAEWSRAGHRRLHDAGAAYYLWSGSLHEGPEDQALTARLVTDWSAEKSGIDRFVNLARG